MGNSLVSAGIVPMHGIYAGGTGTMVNLLMLMG